MSNEPFIPTLFKRFFWTLLDYILKFMIVSFLWFLFHLPVFYFLLILFISHVTHIYLYWGAFLIIIFSPVSFGAAYYVLQIASQYFTSDRLSLFHRVEDASGIKLGVFFKGMGKYLSHSALLILLNLILSFFLYVNVWFYWTVILPRVQIIGLFLTGIIFWAIILYVLSLFYLVPIILLKKLNVFKAFYQSLLLVIDNIFYTLSNGVFLLSFLFIMVLTVAGLGLIFFGAFMLFQILATLVLYQKYDETLQIRDERRTLKNIIKPWD
ncbi:MAG: hypothetical protein JW827_08665 [Spirochaetes bacterium]|nr:hypothetical protein [Spirochaetota bacterium]